MKLLLDTHVFLWLISADQRLPGAWQEIIQDPENEVYLSVVSLWESIVKYQLGKLSLPESPETYLPRQRDRHRIGNLVLDEGSVARLASLPALHRDPFDRMLVCQALHHRLALATLDGDVLAYNVEKVPR
jgi:PIN domain nuclease of toxin-antitoxin system